MTRVDWGRDDVFTLSGWTLDMLADALRDKAVEPLLKEYQVESLNVFGICIGGSKTAYLINREMKRDKRFAAKFHKIAFYGSPILGARDLGGASSPPTTQDREPDLRRPVGPLRAFMDVLQQAFASGAGEKEAFHFAGDVRNIHFFNLVGERDYLVMPSASIVDWQSDIPGQFASFEQLLFAGGHFTFARPCFNEVKLAQWFADDRERVAVNDGPEAPRAAVQRPLRIASRERARAA